VVVFQGKWWQPRTEQTAIFKRYLNKLQTAIKIWIVPQKKSFSLNAAFGGNAILGMTLTW
jgi:hypothetical protein